MGLSPDLVTGFLRVDGGAQRHCHHKGTAMLFRNLIAAAPHFDFADYRYLFAASGPSIPRHRSGGARAHRSWKRAKASGLR